MAVTQDNIEMLEQSEPATIVDLDAVRNEAVRKETVGQTLVNARNAAGLSLSDVVLATKIKQVHLEAIEASDMSELPAVPFTAGFIKVYATHLGLEAPLLVNRFKDEVAETESVAVPASRRGLADTGFEVAHNTKLASLAGVGAISLFALWMIIQVFKGPSSQLALADAAEMPPALIVTDEISPSPQLIEEAVSDPTDANTGEAAGADFALNQNEEQVDDFLDVFATTTDQTVKLETTEAILPEIEDGVLEWTLSVPTLKNTLFVTSNETEIQTERRAVSGIEDDVSSITNEPVESLEQVPVTDDASTIPVLATLTEVLTNDADTNATEEETQVIGVIEELAATPISEGNSEANEPNLVEGASEDSDLALTDSALSIDELNRQQLASVASNDVTKNNDAVESETDGGDLLSQEPVAETSNRQFAGVNEVSQSNSEDTSLEGPAKSVEPDIPSAIVTRQAAPEYPSRCERNAADVESVGVIFDILPSGRTANLGIKETTNDCFNDAAMTAVKRMRFSPRRIDGVARMETGRVATLNFPK